MDESGIRLVSQVSQKIKISIFLVIDRNLTDSRFFDKDRQFIKHTFKLESRSFLSTGEDFLS